MAIILLLKIFIFFLILHDSLVRWYIVYIEKFHVSAKIAIVFTRNRYFY